MSGIVYNQLIRPTWMRIAELLEKRNQVATRNFLACVVEDGRALGYNVDRGDRCFIHPTDIPKGVKLTASDPVVPSEAPAMVPGQLLWASSREIPQCLFSKPILVKTSKEIH